VIFIIINFWHLPLMLLHYGPYGFEASFRCAMNSYQPLPIEFTVPQNNETNVPLDRIFFIRYGEGLRAINVGGTFNVYYKDEPKQHTIMKHAGLESFFAFPTPARIFYDPENMMNNMEKIQDDPVAIENYKISELWKPGKTVIINSRGYCYRDFKMQFHTAQE